MFYDAKAFNGDIAKWDLPRETDQKSSQRSGFESSTVRVHSAIDVSRETDQKSTEAWDMAVPSGHFSAA